MLQVCASDKHQQHLYFVNPLIQLLTPVFFYIFWDVKLLGAQKNDTWPCFEQGLQL